MFFGSLMIGLETRRQRAAKSLLCDKPLSVSIKTLQRDFSERFRTRFCGFAMEHNCEEKSLAEIVSCRRLGNEMAT